MIKVLLFASLVLLFYSLVIGEFPNVFSIRKFLERFLVPAAGAMVFFFGGTYLFQTPFAGLPWAVLGWFTPGWVIGVVKKRKHNHLKSLAKDFVTSAAGLFAVGQMTSEVVRTMADKFSEPFAGEFQNMISIRNMSPHASFPRMFNDLGEKYNLPEFKAVATILAASERAGGPAATARGLKKLGRALRQRDRLLKERNKAMMESKIAAIVAILILSVGLILDATVFRSLFEGPGVLVMAISSTLVVGLIFMVVNVIKSKDLE